MPAATSDYEIQLDRIDTHEKLVLWINHLSTKDWVTVKTIESLILTVSDHYHWRLGPLPA